MNKAKKVGYSMGKRTPVSGMFSSILLPQQAVRLAGMPSDELIA